MCFRLGEKVGAYPVRTIVIMFIVAFVCMAGLSRFRQESRPNKLWVPRNAEALDQKEWVGRVFPETARYGFLIVTPTKGENVLTPAVLKEVGLRLRVVHVADWCREENKLCCLCSSTTCMCQLLTLRHREALFSGAQYHLGAALL